MVVAGWALKRILKTGWACVYISSFPFFFLFRGNINSKMAQEENVTSSILQSV